MRILETKVYTYDELSDDAKEKAREWWVNLMGPEDYADQTIEDFEQICNILGVELDQKQVPLMGGNTRTEPKVYYSGFSSQGDGASFDGSYTYNKGAAKAIRAYMGGDSKQTVEMYRIADALTVIQKKHGYRLKAKMKVSDAHYVHSNMMEVTVWKEDRDGYEVDTSDDIAWGQAEDAIIELMRDLADWLYKQLEQEYDYQSSEEAVAEVMRSNEYTFTEDGEREG